MSPFGQNRTWWTKKTISTCISSRLLCPRILSKCQIEISSIDPNIPEETEVIINKPSSLFFIAIEECLWGMKQGEVCDLDIQIQNCPYLLKYEEIDKIPSNVRLKLVSFTPGGQLWNMDHMTKLEHSEDMKAAGVDFFKTGNQSISFWYFSRALRILVTLPTEAFNDDEDRQTLRRLKLSCYLNLSLFQLNNESYHKVVRNCTKALELDPDCVKALYRRGSALTELQEFDEANSDLRRALSLDVGNKSIEKQLKVLNRKIAAYNLQCKNSMKKMFDS